MSLLRHAARTMLASYFVVGGLDAVRDPYSQVEGAGDVAEGIARRIGPLPEDDPATTIRAIGAVQMAAGLALVTDTATRPAALVLAATLAPSTLGEHRFWEAEKAERKGKLIQFTKHLGLIGGLLIVAMDTEGKPGVAWKTSYAVRRAGELAEHQREIVELRADLARERARHATAETATRVRATARQARRDAKMGRKVGRGAGRAVSSARRGTTRAIKAVSPF